MHADFDLGLDGSVTPTTHGGRRAGAGRPKGSSNKKAAAIEAALADGDDDPAEGSQSATAAVRKAIAVARKEAALADLNELEFKVKSGQYLSRDAFREATATLLAELAQGLRSLPDTLERKHGLAPAVVQAIEADIDDALARVSEGLEMFTGAAE